MIVAVCFHDSRQKHGKDRYGVQRYKCNHCGKTFVEETAKPLGGMRIEMKDAALALNMLLEGMSMRAVSRLTGLDRGTLDNLILTVGANCEAMMNGLRNVQATNVEVDEIWSFIGLKEKRRDMRGYGREFGDSWTWIAVDADHKMVLAYHIGEREANDCWTFISKLRDATTGRFQLTSDGLVHYRTSVPMTLKNRVDYGQLVKKYGRQPNVGGTTRYSPSQIIGAEKHQRFGNPNFDRICTSHVESLNQKLRMGLRRFTRLTNAHSKGFKQHAAMQAIWFAFYNWVRKHETIKSTPAMAAGLTDHQWSLSELMVNAASKNQE
jgi:transposase-like protein/IS1 family transposase